MIRSGTINSWSIVVLAVGISLSANAAEFSHKLETQLRIDKQTDKELRLQHRLRYFPQVSLDNGWSLNAFLATGDKFDSAHDTSFDGTADRFYMRRLFVRKEHASGKTEVGVIPTYKGRVSSSGISKDGYISGVRHVTQIGLNSAFEVVIGELGAFEAKHAMSAPDDLNYFEAEYSARLGERHSYEVSFERLLESNFLRTEYRFQAMEDRALFVEYIRRFDVPSSKGVVGVSGSKISEFLPYSFFVHYSYVSDEFGLRAELTEDFLGTGHGFSAEVGQKFRFDDRFAWFVRYDVVDSTSRLLTGVNFKL